MIEKGKQAGRRTFEIAWAALILLLPITSFPLISRLTGGTMVAPASLIPLGWLAIFWFLAYLFRKGTLPRESIPFLFFICMAVIASAMAFFLNVPSFRGQGILGEEISALVTLAIGAGFYLITAGWIFTSKERLRRTLKLFNFSGMILLGWAIVQAFYIYRYHGDYPAILFHFQRTISIRDLFLNRVTSFAFEPSWLAHMVNLSYLPIWLAATITGWSAFGWRLWKISVENILLVVGAGILFISSRVGTLSFLMVIAFLGVYFTFYLAGKMRQWVTKRLANAPGALKKIVSGLLPVIILVFFLGIYGLGTIGLVKVLSHVDKRLAVFFSITSLLQLKTISVSVYTVLNYLQFAERYVYWVAGWNIFNLHPIFGVGLGNAGFFFQRALPPYSWNLPEVMESLYRATFLLNIKSLWLRLLAETGITGFAAFATWLLVMAKASWGLKKAQSSLMRMVGWTGLFVLIAFLIEGFSVDTFALPYVWVSLGMVSAAAALLRKEGQIG
jgi:hypothetical protein